MIRKEAGRAELALTQIRLSTLHGFHERLVHLTLGQTRRLLGGTVAPAGACSSHRNPRREREGDVRCPLQLKRLGDVTRSLAESCDSYACAWGRGWSERGKECLLFSEGSNGLLPALPFSGTWVSQSLYPTTPASSVTVSPGAYPEWGTGHFCKAGGQRNPTDTDVNIQTTNTKANTSTSSSKSEPRERCVWGAKRGSV